VKFLKQGLCLAVVGAGLAAVPGLQATAAAPHTAAAPDRSLVQQMKDGARGSVAISAARATGKVSFARAELDGDLLPGVNGATNPVGKASAFLDKYSLAFGASRSQVVQDAVSSNAGGSTVTYVQRFNGVPVFGGMVKAHIDADGDLTAVNGRFIPVGGLSTDARLTPADAGNRAVALVRAEPPSAIDGRAADTRGIKAKTTTLEVYRTGLVQGRKNGINELVYQVEVANGGNVRDMVFLDANTGKVINRYSTVDDALSRELYETSPDAGNLVWAEGDPFPGTLNSDQQSMVQSTGDAYWLFKNVFGRDSFDGLGSIMKTVNNDPRINCPNANWNGATTNYCDGVSSDDVVAHEWGHAYTEYTDNLIYQWQSGALNEGYSDIWGETVDLINNRLDEDEGDLTKKRPVGLCSTHSPANPLLTINTPAGIAKDCTTAGAAFGPELSGTGVTGDVVMALDADEDADGDPNPFDTGGSVYDGCTPPFTNAADLVGKIVMINRGLCGFEVKARNAEAAGAIGVIIGNRNPDETFAMSGDANPDPTISSVMVDKNDRNLIAGALDTGSVNVTMKDASGDRVDSFRWLIGEKSDAFGGAIRDMWTPTCYGDPGKVSDAQYKCSSDDNGGVHGNSGVVNHSYSLLVDGGTFNGQTITGLGLDKAANIYFKAQSEYLTPISDFPDLADSLESACADLTGHALKNLSVEPNHSTVANSKITSADCDQVHAMTLAVELRKDPTGQCAWQPLLNPHAPEACGADFKPSGIFSDDFESGLGNWTLSGENPFGGATYDWEAKLASAVPGGHDSAVAFGPDPKAGDCSGGPGDISSANYMDSGDIVIPADALAPRLTFEHYIATEAGFDGGNVQLSVDGGAFAPIAAAAYTFNGPGHLSTTAQGSTNPLQDEDGFTGTNPGSPFGSWGESNVDLNAAGAGAGHTVKLRFAMGRDGCGGVDGWYVDNVKVVNCVEKAVATATGFVTPDPVSYGTARSLTVTVAGNDPTGDVTVTDGADVLGTIPLVNGSGSLPLSTTMSVGPHTLSLAYSGDANNKSAEGTASVTVDKVVATVTGSVAPASVAYGTARSLTVTVAGSDPTGDVTVTDGATVLGTITLAGGTGSLPLSTTMGVGPHSLSLAYAGDGYNESAEGSASVTITKAVTTTHATAPTTVKFRADFKVKVKVTAAGAVPKGTVKVFLGTTLIGHGTLSATGTVTITVTKDIAVGKKTLTVKYLGSANFGASQKKIVVTVTP
jgi:Zn-dependent metalloprotease